MLLPRRLLDRPAPEGIRWIALARLQELVAARQRLDDPDDAAAVHDFRVVLRRFRSLVRTNRAVLGDGVTRKSRRRLKRLASATGLSRDSEVRLEWVRRRVKRGRTNVAGLEWVEGELERDRIKGNRKLQRAIDRDFAPLVDRLQRSLRQVRITTALGETPAVQPTRDAIAQALRGLATAMVAKRGEARAAADPALMHPVRIAAKRLRYALEPLVDETLAPASIRQTAGAAITQLKRMQDAFGDLHDEVAFDQWLAGAKPDDLATGRAQRAFIARLRQRLQRQALRRYRALDNAPWRHRIDRIIQRAHAVADHLVRTKRTDAAAPAIPDATPAPSRSDGPAPS